VVGLAVASSLRNTPSGQLRGSTAARILAGAALLAAVLAAPLRLSPQGKSSWSVETVLRELDEQSKHFRSMTADLERTKVTVVVNDKSSEYGQIFVRHDGKMLIELTKPDARTILRSGDNLWIYMPRTKRLEEYNLGKHRAVVDQLLLLGLGTSSKDLKKHYLLTVLPEETMDGKKAVVLELTPKDAKIRNQIARINIWFDALSWLPMQQKFFETGSGDYFLIHYSNIARNVKLPDSRFKEQWPKDTKPVKPQG
jgi:outer membrane lipoprotein-sorting protein